MMEEKKEKKRGIKSKDTPPKAIGFIKLLCALMKPLSLNDIMILLGNLSERGVYRYLGDMGKAGLKLFGFEQLRFVKNEEKDTEEEKLVYLHCLLPEPFSGRRIDNIYVSHSDKEGCPVELVFSLYDETSGEQTSETVVVEKFSILLFGVMNPEEEESADEMGDEK